MVRRIRFIYRKSYSKFGNDPVHLWQVLEGSRKVRKKRTMEGGVPEGLHKLGQPNPRGESPGWTSPKVAGHPPSWKGTLANPEDLVGSKEMAKKVEEVAAKKIKGLVSRRALVERGFSLPPSDFFTEILKEYNLQRHNISPNSILAIANHETVPQTSLLATCGSITFKLRPDCVYPHTDWHESVRYWSGGFFYVKDRSDPAISKTLPKFKDGPASETPAWTKYPHISETPQLMRAVRRICKLTEDGLSGKDLTMSWFTKRIQPLQHRDHVMYQYTGCDDNMRASKDNLSGHTLDKRIRVMIKIPRGVHSHTDFV
ncbi:hypothetical protein QYE76_024871 [Lolium multiflorum]|uniref:Transposase (putative) gypsy type domain-containing protein n=1 Tax=Lolium multiflorum TaxID=4521 RepID=A0AAD8VU24_LOLMU|nr:hypothetical protein QYE76_024871 [Lolium multiflorum]